MSSSTRIVLALIEAVIAALLGNISIFKLSPVVNIDWKVLKDIMSDKIRTKEVGDCRIMYDRDTGVIVREKCDTFSTTKQKVEDSGAKTSVPNLPRRWNSPEANLPRDVPTKNLPRRLNEANKAAGSDENSGSCKERTVLYGFNPYENKNE